MVVISKSIIRDFIDKYPEAKNSIDKWFDEVNSADSVGNDRYIFDIKGNQIGFTNNRL